MNIDVFIELNNIHYIKYFEFFSHDMDIVETWKAKIEIIRKLLEKCLYLYIFPWKMFSGKPFRFFVISVTGTWGKCCRSTICTLNSKGTLLDLNPWPLSDLCLETWWFKLIELTPHRAEKNVYIYIYIYYIIEIIFFP